MSLLFGKNFIGNPRKSQPALEKPIVKQINKFKSARNSRQTSPNNEEKFHNYCSNNERNYQFVSNTKSLQKLKQIVLQSPYLQ